MTNLHLMNNEIWLSCVLYWTKRGGWKIPKTVKKSLQIAKIAGIYKYELFHHLTLVKAIQKVPNSFEAYQTEPRKLDLLPVRDLLSSPIITIIIHNPPILMISKHLKGSFEGTRVSRPCVCNTCKTFFKPEVGMPLKQILKGEDDLIPAKGPWPYSGPTATCFGEDTAKGWLGISKFWY